MQLIRKKKISQLPLLESTTENTYVHVVDSDENYRIEADKITASLASKTYVDQQDALKVDKVDGKSLIADTEISRLAGVDNQTLSGLGGEPSANKQDSLAVDGSGTKFPTVDAVNLGLATKSEKTTQVVAGAGLTGGGTLESDRTLNVVSANDGITVNADNIQLNAVDNLASTSSTQPLSAKQGKELNDKKVEKVVGKQLSTEDYTTTEKSKVANVPLNTNTELAAKVDKVTGKSLILDTEISRLASVTNQTLSGLGGEAVSNKTQTLTNSETDYPSGKAVTAAVLSISQSGYIKPTDAAPTPARNGNYTFSIGGNKPVWLTAEAGITTVKAGDGVAVVYTAPSTYSYTHVNMSSDFVQKETGKSLVNDTEIAKIHTQNTDSILKSPDGTKAVSMNNDGGFYLKKIQPNNPVYDNFGNEIKVTEFSSDKIIGYKNKAYGKKIVGIGSSVMFGYGATDNNGWFNMLKTVLEADGFVVKNKSIGGNTTQDAINRFYVDVVSENPDIVVVSLNLRNGGISDGDVLAKTDIFIANMQKIIGLCYQNNYKVIICTPYPADDYTDLQYKCIKNIISIFSTWNVPVIDLISNVIDNSTTGHYISSLQIGDGAHPNDAGYLAMYSAVDKSIFYDESKRDYVINAGFFGTHRYAYGNESSISNRVIYYPIAPADKLNFATVSFWFRKKQSNASTMVIWSGNDSNTPRLRHVNDNIIYYATSNSAIDTGVQIEDFAYHHFCIVFNKSQMKEYVYIDGVLVGLANITTWVGLWNPTFLSINTGEFNYANSEIKDIAIYRTALNIKDIIHLKNGNIRKASIIGYWPLNDSDVYVNCTPRNYLTGNKLSIGTRYITSL